MNGYDSLVISRMRTVGEGAEVEWDWIDFQTLSGVMQRELVQVARRVHRRLSGYNVVQNMDDVLTDVLKTLGIRQLDA